MLALRERSTAVFLWPVDHDSVVGTDTLITIVLRKTMRARISTKGSFQLHLHKENNIEPRIISSIHTEGKTKKDTSHTTTKQDEHPFQEDAVREDRGDADSVASGGSGKTLPTVSSVGTAQVPRHSLPHHVYD